MRVVLGGVVSADSAGASRVLETSHPPSIYIPPGDFAPGSLTPAEGASFCEWKGRAGYLDVTGGGVSRPQAAWTYPDPTPGFAAIAGFVSLYPGRMDSCHLGDDPVEGQEGDFYGGWITPEIVGPFKGAPGTWGW